MNHVKVKNRVWLALAALLIFWLGDWMGHTYQITGGTTTQKLATAMNLQVLLTHPMRLSANAFSLMCGVGAVLLAGLFYLCLKYSKHRLMPQREYGSARWSA